jgi:predicted adenine nucleotide alpha hydrolase (AANH) superfamily ATPase
MKSSLNEEDFIATLLYDEDKREDPSSNRAKLIIDKMKQNGKKQLAPLPNSKFAGTKDQVKNSKLVSVLKNKMFKGYSKVKNKAEAIVKPQLRPISALYVNGKRYNVKLKNTIHPVHDSVGRNDELNFLKIEKYVDDTYYLIKDELQNSKPTGNGEYKKLFLTADKFKSAQTSTGFYSTEQEEKEKRNLKVLKQIFNNNLDEAKHYNSVSFLAFEVKRPKWNPLAGTNKTIIEKEILREVENVNRNNPNQTSNNLVNNLGRTTKSENIFKSPNFEKDHNKKSYLSFYSNPGLHKFKGTRQAKSAGQAQTMHNNNININMSLNTEKQFYLSGSNFNKTHTESIRGIVPIHSKNDSVIEYAAKTHSNFFTTNLHCSSEKNKKNNVQPISGIFLKDTQKENYLKNFENIKIVEKLKRKGWDFFKFYSYRIPRGKRKLYNKQQTSVKFKST